MPTTGPLSPTLTRPFRRADLVGMPSVTRLYTVDDVRALPDDGNRYETRIEGLRRRRAWKRDVEGRGVQ